ncbi:hypothetical protein MPL3365_200144 [Mesorhizobium plurifarium]|uniref:Transposase IS801/IS1294 domain-containing protein n=1 Tax=Mesorhizobium plurifarium TaxID=69974 RepID=A0A090G318_MESPL|nr:hypothetical protein MPL3365_200144 [Mesorhizobium plurifarium]
MQPFTVGRSRQCIYRATRTGCAISNRLLIAFNESGTTFRDKDYRREGADQQQLMTLATEEFICRFLLHVLPGILPHPALRPPCRLCSQGQPRACSLLWRPHDRERGVRTMAAAALAATRFPVDRDQQAMTGMEWFSLQLRALCLRQRLDAHPWGLSTPTEPRRAGRRADNTAQRRIEAVYPHSCRRHPVAVAPSPTPAEIRNPHSHRLWPARSFLGACRTPAGARNSSREQKGSYGETGRISVSSGNVPC